MKEELLLTTERIDDVVLLLALMQQMDLPAILDRHLPRHGLQQGLSWGWTASIWLAHILSQGDHRKLTVRDWVRQAHNTLERVTRPFHSGGKQDAWLRRISPDAYRTAR